MDMEPDDEPKHLPELCCGVSEKLIRLLLDHLSGDGSLVLSIGCGSGLLEAILLRAAANAQKSVKLCGVEVPSCSVPHLPEDCILRVSGIKELYPDAVLASTLLFVYPREPELVESYIQMTLLLLQFLAFLIVKTHIMIDAIGRRQSVLFQCQIMYG